jgi:uncharacterized protein
MINDTRILEDEQGIIVKAILNYDNDAKIYLFGSRTDLTRKGGDIDILILSDIIKKKDIIYIENNILKIVKEQKIDFLITGKNISDSFIQMIIDKGILIS